MQKFRFLIILGFLMFSHACGLYSFTGTNLDERVKTIQVDYFPNNAVLVEPSLSNTFTDSFRDLFLQQTNLGLVNSGGDLIFEGEITGYKINPMTATAEQTAAQNRLTITVNIRFYNKFVPEDDFEKTFSHYYDYDGSQQLVGGILDDAFNQIIERITQDIFNASVAKW